MSAIAPVTSEQLPDASADAAPSAAAVSAPPSFPPPADGWVKVLDGPDAAARIAAGRHHTYVSGRKISLLSDGVRGGGGGGSGSGDFRRDRADILCFLVLFFPCLREVLWVLSGEIRG